MVPTYLRGYEAEYHHDPLAAALRWFRDAGFGMFLHYGLYSLLARHEWVQLTERIPVAEYEKLAEQFTAERFDAGAIASLAAKAGCRYINITTRHHEGFCLWDTATTDFNSVKVKGCGRDLVAELAEACEKHSLGLCLYYSHGRDWRHPHAPNNGGWGGHARPYYHAFDPAYAVGPEYDMEKYVQHMEEQVTELLSNYGPIASIWLDGIMVPLQPRAGKYGQIVEGFQPARDGDAFRCQDLYDLVHRLQPQCLVSYKQGYLGTEDYFAPEHSAAGAQRERYGDKPTEVCTTLIHDPDHPMQRSWGHYEGMKHISADDAWAALRTAQDAGHNLLLNTGPLGDGSIDPHDAEVFREVGRRMGGGR